MRRWYARRGISWTPLLACCAVALVCAAMAQRWPHDVSAFLPEVLAVCAAGAGFVFDEAAGAVVAVTPRGAGWRRTTRITVCAIPLAIWCLVVTTVPDEAGLDRAAWLLAGVAVVLLAGGGACLASRAGAPTPGAAVSALVAMALLAPHLMSQFVGWGPFPFGAYPASVTVFWSVAAVAGFATCAWALRPGLR